jgi:hypothetical protein
VQCRSVTVRVYRFTPQAGCVWGPLLSLLLLLLLLQLLLTLPPILLTLLYYSTLPNYSLHSSTLPYPSACTYPSVPTLLPCTILLYCYTLKVLHCKPAFFSLGHCMILHLTYATTHYPLLLRHTSLLPYYCPIHYYQVG